MKFRFTRLLLGAFLIGAVSSPALGQFRAATRPQVPLPEGPVRDVILKTCVRCHGIDDYAFNALDREGWQALIDEKHKQARGVQIAAQDETVLLAYLVEHFGPDSIPFPREYIPPEIDTFFSDADARVFLEVTCAECHEIRVFNERKTPAGWRALVVDMRERGARLSDENLERLVEWLGRVRGTNPFE